MVVYITLLQFSWLICSCADIIHTQCRLPLLLYSDEFSTDNLFVRSQLTSVHSQAADCSEDCHQPIRCLSSANHLSRQHYHCPRARTDCTRQVCTVSADITTGIMLCNTLAVTW